MTAEKQRSRHDSCVIPGIFSRDVIPQFVHRGWSRLHTPSVVANSKRCRDCELGNSMRHPLSTTVPTLTWRRWTSTSVVEAGDFYDELQRSR